MLDENAKYVMENYENALSRCEFVLWVIVWKLL